jgi:hypothetical protein
MKKLIFLLVAVLVCCFNVSQGTAGVQIKGVASTSRVTPRFIPSLARLEKLDETKLPAIQADGPQSREELFDIPPEEFERLEALPKPVYDGKGTLTIDRGAALQPLSIQGVQSVTGAKLSVNFEGNLYGNSWPGDPMVAVGPKNVISTANSSIRIRSKTGALQQTVSAMVFLGAAHGGFDPKIEYDGIAHRFIMLFDDQSSPYYAVYYVGISQTDDAMGGWFVYQFDMTLDGSTQTSHWADFPGLGYDNNCIYMTGNMYSMTAPVGGSDTFFYVKTRVVDKNAMYLGIPVGYSDIIGIPGAGTHFTMKPAQSLSPTDVEYLAIHPNGGGSILQIYQITGGPDIPVLTNIGNLPVSSYAVPPGGKQQDCSQTTIDAGDARTQDPVWRDGYLYLANQGGITLFDSALCVLQYYKVKTSPLTLVTNETYAAQNEFYLYPAVTVDAKGTAFFTFSRMSVNEYASGAYAVKRLTDSSIEPSSIMKGGLSSYWCGQTGHRWGDYEAISIDPSDSTDTLSSAWIVGNWAKGPTVWGSWVGKISLNFHQIQGTVFSDCDSNSLTAGDRKPLPSVTVTLSLNSVNLASTVTDSTGSYSFTHLDDGAYDVIVSIPNNSYGLAAFAGTGATSQTVVNDTDIQVTLANANIASQYSINNNFAMVVQHVVPTASNLVPDNYSSGEPGFIMTVHGSGLEKCAIVQVDGSGRATTYVDSTTLHASILASDLVALGTRTITIFNPTPSGGTSNGLLFTIHTPAPVFSGEPSPLMFGNQFLGAPVTDTITVTNIGTADLIISNVISDSVQFNVVPTSGTIPRQTSLPFLVTYIPTVFGSATGHIVFTHNASSSPDTFNISGTGIDSTMFLTGSYDNWASAVDAKNAHKSYPRKADKVFFKFTMKTPINPALTSSLVLTFGAAITQMAVDILPGGPGDTLPYTSRTIDTKRKIWTYTFAALPPGHYTFQLNGVGSTGTKAKLTYIWYDASKTHKLKGKLGDSLCVQVLNAPGLPEPNLINVGEELFPKGVGQVTSYFSDANPLIVGIPLGSKHANSVRLKKYADVLKSLVDVRSNARHTQPPSCLIFTMQQTSLAPLMHNNSMFAELLTLKLNIAASATGKFPPGFGELTYLDSTNPSNVFNGKVIKYVVPSLDSMISCDDNFIHDTAKAMAFLRQVNGSFSDPKNQKDTFSFLLKTMLKGVTHITQVPWLHKTPGLVPVIIQSPNISNAGVPERYQLYQNYPNPFNPTTMIRFSLPEQSIVSLKVYNVLGQEVASLLKSEVLDQGIQEVEFDANRISSGVYFYRIMVYSIIGDMDSPDATKGSLRYSDTKKMLLMR